MSSDARPSSRSRLLAPFAVVVALAGGLAALSSPGAAVTDDEAVLAGLVNGARSSAGLPPLAVSEALSDLARAHAASMAASGTLSHSGGTGGAVGSVVPDWTSVAENVGVAGSVAEAHAALLGSAEHRANILGDFTLLGVGVARGSDGRVWVAELFAKAAATVAEPVSSTTTVPAVVAAASLTSPTAAGAAVAPAEAREAPRPKPSQASAKRPRVRPASSGAVDDGSCLPAPAQPQGRGHAYGRCEHDDAGPSGGRR